MHETPPTRLTIPLAGTPVPPDLLVDVPRLMTACFSLAPDAAISAQRVTFGTSGHRGSAFATAFNEAHVAAITQAICLYRQYAGIDGPLFLGINTHALSQAAFATAIEVLAANGVETMVEAAGGYHCTSRPARPQAGEIGTTLVSSAMRDRVGIFRPCRIEAAPNNVKSGGFLRV